MKNFEKFITQGQLYNYYNDNFYKRFSFFSCRFNDVDFYHNPQYNHYVVGNFVFYKEIPAYLAMLILA